MTGKTSEVYESLDKKYPVDMEVIPVCVSIVTIGMYLIQVL